MKYQAKTKYEFCPCGCGQVLLPSQMRHTDPVSTHDEYAEACSHCAHKEEQGASDKKKLTRIGIGACLYAAAMIFVLSGIREPVLYLAAYLVIGGDVLLRAGRNIAHGRVFDENLLMSIATIGAFAIREYPEAVAVMLFYQVGELFQDYAVGQSRRSITKLMDIRPDYANLLKDGREQKMSPVQVLVGDVIVVKPGERVPLDGVVQKGSSFADTSALTGESVPRVIKAGDPIYSGYINQSGVIEVCVEKVFAQSTISKILELVQNASEKKAPTEKFISRFARYYTPVVAAVAVLIAAVPPVMIPGAEFSVWLYRALVFLVVSCPCALVISIPLSFFGGIGAASRSGVLVKGGNYLEALRAADTFVFDKTGTLTEGVFKVSNIKTYGPLSSYEVLSLAAHIEYNSSHPIAKSIAEAYAASGKAPDPSAVTDYEEIPGRGIKAAVLGQRVIAGSRRLMEESGIRIPEDRLIGTVVYVAADHILMGALSISDRIRPDAKEAVAALKAAGIKKTVMLTGDRKDAAQGVADELGIDAFYAELLPQDKVTRMEELVTAGNKAAFVGDGINDAPVLARADIGIAMGGLGSDAAIEAADVVIMNDKLSRLAPAIHIARRTRRTVWQNIALAMAVKAVVLALGAGGIATMWEAVFADVGVALLSVLNALRMVRRGSISQT